MAAWRRNWQTNTEAFAGKGWSMIANAAWGMEFILATLGCAFFSRRRVHVVWAWLGFRASADLICFLLLSVSGFGAYSWADYIQRQAQYALIALVSVWTVSQVLREHPKTRRAYLWLLGAMAVCCVLLFHAQLPSAAGVLRFEIWAEITLSGFVALSMGTANGKAPKPWGLIACGLVVLGSSDLLVTALRLRGWRAEGIYPIGEIVSLAILAVAGWRNWPSEARSWGLLVPTQKKPPVSVRLQRQEREWVN